MRSAAGAFIGVCAALIVYMLVMATWMQDKVGEIHGVWVTKAVTGTADLVREAAIASVQANGVSKAPATPDLPVYSPNCDVAKATADAPCIFTIRRTVEWGLAVPMNVDGRVIGYAYDLKVDAQVVQTDKGKSLDTVVTRSGTYRLRTFDSPRTAQLDTIPDSIYATAAPAP